MTLRTAELRFNPQELDKKWQDRWATVLDAVSLSPVHNRVVPKGLPAEPGEQLLAAVKRLSMSVPDIAKAFGIRPTPPPRARRGRSRS